MPVFFLSFLLYLMTLFPGVAPYRDTGEMVSVAHTLGVAHPPGYPLYTIIAKIFLIVMPFADAGYRLNVLSALAGAATVWLLFRIFRKLSLSPFLAAVASLLFAASYLQWYLSLVSEMYTLNTLFAALVLYLLLQWSETAQTPGGGGRLFYTASFLFGLGLGIRMDLLLIGPALAVFVFANRKSVGFRSLFLAALLFAAGFSVFAYLPLRSAAGPFLDWNHPADLSHFWGTLTRKTHGGTLDLISESYAPGENFGATVLFYFRHLWTGFAYAGLPLGVLGLLSLWKRRRDIAAATFLSWALCGPVFIYLSNMPPNTHALAILEAHFVLPNLLFMIWVGEGIRYVVEAGGRQWRFAGMACTVVLCGANLYAHLPDLDKRGNFIAYDYARNVLRSAPPSAMVVMKKDVQLFALWKQQLVDHRRPDIALVSQGLAGSPWYIDKFNARHKDAYVGALRSQPDWEMLVAYNAGRPVFFSGDAEYMRPDGFLEEPDGLLSKITKGVHPLGGVLLKEIYPYRGKYDYEAYREFFTPDLIDDYARAFANFGQQELGNGRHDSARALLGTGIMFRGTFPSACNTLAYSYLIEGKWEEACRRYLVAISQYEAYQAMAAQFNSLPAVRNGIARDTAEVYTALGVCDEKLHNDEEALRCYASAIAVSPAASRAYFNRAVIYWKRNEWSNAARDMESAVRIDPQFKEAAYYLSLVRQKMK